MRKIEFSSDILPHLLAVLAFYIITVAFFNPVIFNNRSINQHDIQQWEGSSKELRDFRESTGEEGLWANSMFSGMPAYLINVEWSDYVVLYTKVISSLGLPHPVRHIFLAFLSFYLLLLCFKVNPYLAIPGAIAFGLSSYMMIGISAGHNARIGAIAFTPLVVGGFHLLFKSEKKWLGALLFAMGTALHLRENHLQITYYLLLILLIYGIIILWDSFKNDTIKSFLKGAVWVAAAGLIAIGSYAGKLWTTLEYSKYSIRGESELTESLIQGESKKGLSKSYAFEYSNGIWEPMTLLIPDFYGGTSSNLLVQDQESETFKVLSRSQNPQEAQQLVRYTSSYWGNQRLSAPYYVGAIMILLFVLGIVSVDRKIVIWLTIISVLGIMLSWGSSFSTFNYFMFDYFPGYNKFRSVTFALYFPLFAIPLLGSLGLQKIWETGATKEVKKKIFIALVSTAGLCMLVLIFAGLASFSKTGETQLPQWFLNALREDRKALMRADALRSLAFILSAVVVIYLGVLKTLNKTTLVILLTFLISIDLFFVSRRYLSEDNFVRASQSSIGSPTDADRAILQDKSDYRVFNIAGDAFAEARTSYFHSSIGGYHGAKLRRYQDLYERQISTEVNELIGSLQAGQFQFDSLGVINMLNIKFFRYGNASSEVIPNASANGSSWLVSSTVEVQSPDDELLMVGTIDTKNFAVVDINHNSLSSRSYNAGGTIQLVEKQPNYLKYSYGGDGNALAVLSEIYYPTGWRATINGEETDIKRVNYVLRAIEIPNQKAEIELFFEPASYHIGNNIVLLSNILLGLLLVFSIYRSLTTKES